MDELPPEMIYHIASYVLGHDPAGSDATERANKADRHHLMSLSRVNRKFNNALEEHLFRSVVVKSPANVNLLDAMCTRAPSRRFTITRITLRPFLPHPENIQESRYMTRDDRFRNNAFFSDMVHRVGQVLRKWEDDKASVGRRPVHLEIKEPQLACVEQRFFGQWFDDQKVALLAPESFPQLKSVTTLDLGDNSEKGGTELMLGLRTFDLRIIPDLLRKLPKLENFHAWVSELHRPWVGWVPKDGFEEGSWPLPQDMSDWAVQPPVTLSRNYHERHQRAIYIPGPEDYWHFQRGLLRDSRHTFLAAVRNVIDKKELPQKIKHFHLQIPNHEEGMSYETVDMVSPLPCDPVSEGLRLLTQTARDVDLRGFFDASLFWPVRGLELCPEKDKDLAIEPAWPNLTKLKIGLHEYDAKGCWYLTHEPLAADDANALQGGRILQPSDWPRPRIEGFPMPHQHYPEDEDPEPRESPNEQALFPIIDALGRATAKMPKIHSILLNLPIPDDKTQENDDPSIERKSWGLRYLGPISDPNSAVKESSYYAGDAPQWPGDCRLRWITENRPTESTRKLWAGVGLHAYPGSGLWEIYHKWSGESNWAQLDEGDGLAQPKEVCVGSNIWPNKGEVLTKNIGNGGREYLRGNSQ